MTFDLKRLSLLTSQLIDLDERIKNTAKLNLNESLSLRREMGIIKYQFNFEVNKLDALVIEKIENFKGDRMPISFDASIFSEGVNREIESGHLSWKLDSAKSLQPYLLYMLGLHISDLRDDKRPIVQIISRFMTEFEDTLGLSDIERLPSGSNRINANIRFAINTLNEYQITDTKASKDSYRLTIPGFIISKEMAMDKEWKELYSKRNILPHESDSTLDGRIYQTIRRLHNKMDNIHIFLELKLPPDLAKSCFETIRNYLDAFMMEINKPTKLKALKEIVSNGPKASVVFKEMEFDLKQFQ
jgi:hypothetical protein